MINYMIWSIAGWHASPFVRIAKKKPKAKLHIWLRSRGDIVFFRFCAGDPLKQANGFISTTPLMAHMVPGIELQMCSNCLTMITHEGQEISDYFENINATGDQLRLINWLYQAGALQDAFDELPFLLSLAMDEHLELGESIVILFERQINGH